MCRISLRSAFLLASSISAAAIATHASASTYKVLYSFCHGGKFVCADGKAPAANLVADGMGNLYGTTSAGGSTGNGVIFELVRSGRDYNTGSCTASTERRKAACPSRPSSSTRREIYTARR